MAAKSEWRPGPTVCRCCLTEGCYKDISTEYFWMGKREVYAEMLKDTLEVTIAYSKAGGPNSNSRLICESCISRLRDATEFKRQVVECERMFMQHLDPGSSSAAIEAETEPVGKIKVEGVKLEKSNSDDDFDNRHAFGDDDDDDDDDLDNQPLTKLASKMPTKESVDLLDLLDNSKTAEKRKSSTKVKPPPPKKAKSKVEQVKVKPSGSKLTPKPEKKKKGLAHDNVKWIPKRQYYGDRNNAAIILECSNVCPFRWSRGVFTCAFCSQTFGDFKDVRQHVIEHPNKIEALKLARYFDNIKVDISSLRCELCLTNIESLDSLKDHLVNKHNKQFLLESGLGVTPFLLGGEKQYPCTHCDETFEVFSKLNNHINQHYPNNICFQCGKAFSAAHRLLSHLVTHEPASEAKYKCSKCDQKFSTKATRNSHMALAHGPEYRYRCPYCKECFKSYPDRTKHLKQYHDKKIEYPCHLCPAVFSICNQRTKHIKYVHIRHKQFGCDFCPDKFVTKAQLKNHIVKHIGERKYQCEVCKKAYARPKTLREHMRIHNNDKRFVCHYCNNAYVQKCSLQSHMRTHHPNAEPLKKVKLRNMF
ncbi:zinc finger protein 676 isoform X12 [Amyelois transitella]|uniref:zinc finger protein 676 isoform X12 n=1 Tax=Amyelois transitella TaxID=680683 RepID=UPI00298F7745|nr:zinc finger protein 676 isoform X12 [Amyelois transitella]XP_060809181.1 zinc finger protein 676 isoform X12 [Amyelois transitella]